jgi:hypothetical protein
MSLDDETIVRWLLNFIPPVLARCSGATGMVTQCIIAVESFGWCLALPVVLLASCASHHDGQSVPVIQNSAYDATNVTLTAKAQFYYVSGQVNNSGDGRFLYKGPITLLGALVAARDFNAFANKRHVKITRADGTMLLVDPTRATNPLHDPPIYPGDRIWVGSKWF